MRQSQGRNKEAVMHDMKQEYIRDYYEQLCSVMKVPKSWWKDKRGLSEERNENTDNGNAMKDENGEDEEVE